jgi:hypothetical protein
MVPFFPTFGLQRLFHYCSIVALVSSYVPYQMELFWLEHVLSQQVNSANVRLSLMIPRHSPHLLAFRGPYQQSVTATLAIVGDSNPFDVQPVELRAALQKTAVYLTTLSLCRIPTVSDRDIVAMEKAKSLESLYLFMLPVRCEFLGSMTSDYLRFVTIRNCQLDDRSLLSLRCTRDVIELDVKDNQLTGICVDGILRMTSVRTLNVSGNRILGRDLERLSSHPSLESIVLSEESVENLDDWKALERLGSTAHVEIQGRRRNGDFATVTFGSGSICVSQYDGKDFRLKERKTLSDLTELDADLFECRNRTREGK